MHHLSFLTKGYHETRARIEQAGLSFRSSNLREVGLWQIFVHDPHGILVELTFEAATEAGPEPSIPPDLEFDAQKIVWFDPAQYVVLTTRPYYPANPPKDRLVLKRGMMMLSLR